MKALAACAFIGLASVLACRAEEAALAKNAVMRADRSLVSLKAGTVVEVLERGEKTASIRYKGQTGTIPLSSLPSAAAPAPGPAAAAAKATAAAPTKPATPPASLVVDQPQSTYGNMVKKAETAVAKHDANVVKPANETTEDAPSK